jgi:PPOX class probable F420-dependent enzyme
VRMFSLPDTPRTRNMQANPKVALNFAGDGKGGDIVVLQGEATVDRDAGGAHTLAPYAEKYAPGFERLGMTAEQFGQKYSEPVTIRITRVRGH